MLFNRGAEALLGYRADDVIGRRMAELYGSEERAKEIMREMRKRGGSVSSLESVLRAKDGGSIPVLISASILFDEEGQEVGRRTENPSGAITVPYDGQYCRPVHQ